MSVLGLPQRKYEEDTSKVREEVESISVKRENRQLGVDIQTSSDVKGFQNGGRVTGYNMVNGPMEKSGVNIGDRIAFVNGARIQSTSEFTQMVEILTRNDIVKIGVVRHRANNNSNNKNNSNSNVMSRKNSDTAVSSINSGLAMNGNYFANLPRKISAPPAVRANIHSSGLKPPTPPRRSSGGGTADLLGIETQSPPPQQQQQSQQPPPQLSAIERALDSMNSMKAIEFLSFTGCPKNKFQAMGRDGKIGLLRNLGVIENFEAAS